MDDERKNVAEIARDEVSAGDETFQRWMMKGG